METHEFTIIATGLDPEADDFESRFYDAGCDDALVSFQKGYVLVDFAREAESLEEAIASAVENCRAAGATVERVEPDPLVSLADIAMRADMTRAAMTNYVKGIRSEGFPSPKARVTTKSPLWDWREVAIWLFRKKRIRRSVAHKAVVVSAANEALEHPEQDFRHSIDEQVRVMEAAH